ncbi:MAG: hypothetical protein ACI9EF_001638, partial [Pseudohongiellaceae bacterium]
TYFDDLGRLFSRMTPWTPGTKTASQNGGEGNVLSLNLPGDPAPAGSAGLLAPKNDA